MKLKLTVILTTLVVTMGLLLGASTAQAFEVIYDGNNATAIKNLEVDNVFYNVEFLFDSAENIYGESLTFDFPDAQKSSAASSAVRAALNSEEAVTTVGEGSGGYQIGYTLFEFLESFQFVAGTQDYYDANNDAGADGEGKWAEDTQALTFTTQSATWADFTEVQASPVAAPVPATGQTISYEDFDDGFFKKGVPSPEPRFTDNENGTVTDNLTKLIWLQDATCFVKGNNTTLHTWTEALALCKDLAVGQCELNDGSVEGDWRLPNVREYISLVDYSNTDPALPSDHPFIDVEDRNDYHSSTSDNRGDSGGLYAYGVSFASGHSSTNLKNQDDMQSVWCVRGGN